MFSPLSIKMTLSMAAAGADGKTSMYVMLSRYYKNGEDKSSPEFA